MQDGSVAEELWRVALGSRQSASDPAHGCPRLPCVHSMQRRTQGAGQGQTSVSRILSSGPTSGGEAYVRAGAWHRREGVWPRPSRSRYRCQQSRERAQGTGGLEGAKAELERALEIIRALYGEDHPSVASIQDNLDGLSATWRADDILLRGSWLSCHHYVERAFGSSGVVRAALGSSGLFSTKSGW